MTRVSSFHVSHEPFPLRELQKIATFEEGKDRAYSPQSWPVDVEGHRGEDDERRTRQVLQRQRRLCHVVYDHVALISRARGNGGAWKRGRGGVTRDKVPSSRLIRGDTF